MKDMPAMPADTPAALLELAAKTVPELQALQSRATDALRALVAP